MKKTIKTLLRSGLVCLFCISLLTSSSYAWYTEYSEGGAEESAVLLASKQARTVPEVQLHWNETYDSNLANWNLATPDSSGVVSAMFEYDENSYEYWEPGYAAVRYLDFELTNAESLSRGYEISASLTNVGDEVHLAQVIDVYFVTPVNGAISRNDLNTENYKGTLGEMIGNNMSIKGPLVNGQHVKCAIVLKMSETAGNEYMDKPQNFNLTFTLTDTSVVSVTQ